MIHVVKNSTLYLLASLFPRGINFLLLPVLTKFINPSDFGIIALVQTIAALLPTFITGQIHKSVSRFYFDHREKNLNILVSSLLFFSLLSSISIILICLLFLESILGIVFPSIGSNYYILFQIMLIAIPLNIISELFVTLLKAKEKAKFTVYLTCFSSIITASSTVYFVILKNMGALGFILSTSIGVTFMAVILLYKFRSFFTYKISFKIIRSPLLYSAPLVLHAFAGYVYMFSDRLIMEKWLSLSVIGIYFFADKLASLFKIIVNQINTAFLPAYTNMMAKGEIDKAKDFSISFSRGVNIFITLIIYIYSLWAPELFYYAFDPKYYSAWILSVALSYSYVFRSLYCFTTAPIFFHKKTNLILKITIPAAVLNIIINLVFISQIGVWAAVISTVSSFIFTYILAKIFSFKVQDFNLQHSRLIANTLLGGALIGVSFYFLNYRNLIQYNAEEIGILVVKILITIVFFTIIVSKSVKLKSIKSAT
jgi:O-antigen/teichoic acid export membrane protein